MSPLIRSDSLDGAIATIPYEAIQAFLGRPGLLSREEVRNAPYVAGMRDRHIVAGADMQVYVKGLEKGAAGRYSIVHAGEALVDPDNGRELGFMGLYSGHRAHRAHGFGVESRLPARIGPRDDQGRPGVRRGTHAHCGGHHPARAAGGHPGADHGIYNGVFLIGQYKVVAINRGERNGLAVGHVLAIDQRGMEIRDWGCYRTRRNQLLQPHRARCRTNAPARCWCSRLSIA